MDKEMGYKERFVIVKPWFKEIIKEVKKDLKSEHLPKDRQFCKRYFLGKHPANVTLEEMAVAYEKEIASGNVGLGEFIASRWVLKNTDIFGVFEKHLMQIDAQYERIEKIEDELAQRIVTESIEQFGAGKTYVFSVLNSVMLSDTILQDIRKLAEEEQTTEKLQKDSIEEKRTERMQAQVSKVEEKLSQRLKGMEKKYLKDTEMLKKQVAHLQKKLDAHGKG